MPEIVYTIEQAAEICKVAPRTVSKWFDSGRLRGFRIPDTQVRQIPQSKLAEFLTQYGFNLPDVLKDSVIVP